MRQFCLVLAVAIATFAPIGSAQQVAPYKVLKTARVGGAPDPLETRPGVGHRDFDDNRDVGPVVDGTADPEAAARLTHAVQPATPIPCHFKDPP